MISKKLLLADAALEIGVKLLPGSFRSKEVAFLVRGFSFKTQIAISAVSKQSRSPWLP